MSFSVLSYELMNCRHDVCGANSMTCFFEIHDSWFSIHNFFNNFFIVEMMLHSFYLLIVFMSFAGNEDDISRLCQHIGGFYCFFSIGNADCLLHIVLVQSGQHIIDDVLRFFKSRVVGSDDDAVAQAGRFLGHDGGAFLCRGCRRRRLR